MNRIDVMAFSGRVKWFGATIVEPMPRRRRPRRR